MPAALLLATCLIVGITDGDTLKARCDTQQGPQLHTIRLAEIDAPERGQPFGNVSRKRLAWLCSQQLAHIQQTATDRYGRAIARVQCKGRDASADMANAGMAWAYAQYQQDASFRAIEAEARQAKRGLWRQINPQPPWEFRNFKQK